MPRTELTIPITHRLRTKSDMINMGEKIAWGSETALMEEAATVIDELREALEWVDEYINTYCILIHPKKTLSCITPEEAIRGKIKEALSSEYSDDTK